MNQLHPIMQAALAPFTQNIPKFDATYCSQCGNVFGPGNNGFSHCADHGQISQERWLAADLANNANKTEQHDAAAMDQQIKFQGVGDGLR